MAVQLTVTELQGVSAEMPNDMALTLTLALRSMGHLPTGIGQVDQ